MPSPTAFLRRLRGKSPRELLRLAPRYATTRLSLAATRSRYWLRIHATRSARDDRRRAALERLRGGGSILFLCHGNICRSPFAERYARARLAAREIEPLDVDSAGTVQLNDPRSPGTARRVARRYGVDLDDHRSVRATAEQIDGAALVVAMDYQNYHTVAERHPWATDRTYLLGLFAPMRVPEIRDPHGYGEETFGDVYGRIAACVDELLDEYERVYEASGGVDDGYGYRTASATNRDPDAPPGVVRSGLQSGSRHTSR
ncbi:hypothetical protein U4E84_02425 [Halorubrum sp. AD140]|uniref:arsenate reductase/protein-tyrosine-phosphatase family protein n=1 Tax=Halorubrum sp. AD140 TaxID=3050073 RepID=UPI002ACD002A|nr:hypothetical protein [Halorubrum sp. AD140]MDZ5810211.1 hypothetical protein [Halorubrum sp. AD140]